MKIYFRIFFIFLFIGSTQILSFVPLTINGLGLKETLYIILFNNININEGVTMARSVIGLIITYVYAFIILSLMKDHLKIEKIDLRIK